MKAGTSLTLQNREAVLLREDAWHEHERDEAGEPHPLRFPGDKDPKENRLDER